MIFKHTDIIRLAISNGRQLHIIRGYHGKIRNSVSFHAQFGLHADEQQSLL